MEKNKNTKLPYNQQISVSRLTSLEKKSKKARILSKIPRNY